MTKYLSSIKKGFALYREKLNTLGGYHKINYLPNYVIVGNIPLSLFVSFWIIIIINVILWVYLLIVYRRGKKASKYYDNMLIKHLLNKDIQYPTIDYIEMVYSFMKIPEVELNELEKAYKEELKDYKLN